MGGYAVSEKFMSTFSEMRQMDVYILMDILGQEAQWHALQPLLVGISLIQRIC